MLIEVLGADRTDEAIALWHVAGLTRPWNDPIEDLRRALDGAASTVLAGVEQGRVIATAMVGHDGHRGWVYYFTVSSEARRRGHGRLAQGAGDTEAQPDGPWRESRRPGVLRSARIRRR
jgi:ribosomal protein S18 acetylase RimI-like enzyme